MREILIYTLLQLCCSYAFSQRVISFSTGNRGSENVKGIGGLTIPETNMSCANEKTIITHQFFNAEVVDMYANDVQYEKLHVKGYGYESEIGKPQLPGYTYIIPLNDRNTELKVSPSDFVEYTGFKIAPAQHHAVGDSKIGDDFVIDDSLYNSNEYYPRHVVRLQGIQEYRGRYYAFVRVNPIQYNPVTDVIRCYQYIQYCINNTCASSIKKSTIDESSNPQPFSKQENFIIATNNTLLQSIDNFVEWKKEQGYKVTILSKSTWESEQEVRDSIWSAYWDNEQYYDTRYLLIIGDYSVVPACVIFDKDGNYVTDHYYACVDDDTDEVEDIARGRIPISTADSVQSVLSFIVEKERSQHFWNRGIHSAFFNILNNKHDEYLNCVSFSEDIKEYMEGHQFLVDRVYKAAYDTDPLRYSTAYANGDSVAYELRRPQFSWDGSYTDIVDALQSGCDYVLYHGHGNYYGLEQIAFTKNTIDNITGGICSPVFFCISCQSGEYVDVMNNGTVLNRPNRFGAKMLDKKISPALVVSAGSCNSPYMEPFGEAMFSSIYPDSLLSPQLGLPSFMYSPLSEINDRGRTEIGEMMRYGFTKMIQSFDLSTFTIEEMTHLHVFGDPSYCFPTSVPHELDSIDIYRLNDSICIDLNGVSPCTVIFMEEDSCGNIQAYKRFEDLSYNYCFGDTSNYNRIIIKKNNSVPVVLNKIKDVYLQDVNIHTNREYSGDNIRAGQNVNDNFTVGDVVVKNGGSLILRHSNKTILGKGFKVELGGKLSVTKK